MNNNNRDLKAAIIKCLLDWKNEELAECDNWLKVTIRKLEGLK